MQEKKPEDIYYEDEIDLYELWLKLKRRWKLILSVVFIGVFLSILYTVMSPKVYTAKGMVKLEYDPVFLMLQKDRSIIPPKAFEELIKATSLNVDGVRSVSANLSIKEPNLVEITIESYSPEVIPPAFDKLIEKLIKSNILQDRINIVKTKLEDRKSKLAKLLNELNAYKAEIMHKDKSTTSNHTAEVSNINQTIAYITDEITKIDILLSTLKPFEVITKPQIPQTYSKPKKKLIVAVAFVSSLFLGIFLALFAEWLEGVRRRHSEVSQR